MRRDEPRSSRSDHGMALVVTLLAMALVSAIGAGLALSSAAARMADHNHEDAVALLNSAEAALELVARDLDRMADWSLALDGRVRSATVDGASNGTRTLADGTLVDLTLLTNEWTCGSPSPCSELQRLASTAERPWGAANPRWQPFLHAPLPALANPRMTWAPYIAAWVGDDAAETDGDPLTDGGGPARDGRYVIRVRAVAFGLGGARRAIEAELSRDCRTVNGADDCRPGIRLQSWKLASSVP